MIKKYRKKEIIEAIQLKKSRESFEECYELIGNACDFRASTDGTFINLITYAGETEQVKIGDWIIKDNENEFYIWDSDTFRETYEEVI